MLGPHSPDQDDAFPSGDPVGLPNGEATVEAGE
jgi:hypothetical protein